VIIAGRARRAVPRPFGDSMSLLTVLLIGLAAWISILLVVVAMCRAAAHADGKDERVDPARTPASTDAPAPNAILVSHH
jgi:hypothetical protein